MALGAKPLEIPVAFGRRGQALTMARLVIGLVLSAIAARSLTALLYGVRPDYVPAVGAASVIMPGVAALACVVPARRAPRFDPVVALRNE
jgi:ABC-type lipoprotein release transport system permease subunit